MRLEICLAGAATKGLVLLVLNYLMQVGQVRGH